MKRSLRKTRRPLRIEPLEQRRVLAVGVIPLDLDLLLSETQSGVSFNGNVKLRSDTLVLNPRLTQPSDINVTNYDLQSSGSFSLDVGGIPVTGTFATDPVTSSVNPDTQFVANQANKTIQFTSKQGGNFTARSILPTVRGRFEADIISTIDFNTRSLTAKATIKFDVDFLLLTRKVSITQTRSFPNVIPASVEFPDVTKGSISGRVFNDFNSDGLRQAGEPGIGDILVSRLAANAADQALETIKTDALGYYAFYNLDGNSTSVSARQFPDQFDFTKNHVGNNRSVDSDFDSLEGRTDPVSLTSVKHQLSIDAGLRTTNLQWQNPNISSDVNNDGSTTAADALSVINLLSRLPAGRNAQDLTAVRAAGFQFYDVDGNGIGNASDALEVIFAIYSEEFGESEQPEIDMIVNLLDVFAERRRRLSDLSLVDALYS